MLGVRGLLPLTLAALAAHYAAAAAPPLNGWFSCSEYTFTEEEPTDTSGSTDFDVAQCATFKAPLCYDGVCTNSANTTTVDIFVKRIQAVAQGKPNIFFMQGGPGASSTAMESAMTGVYALLSGNVNVYTMDHRGTGRSTKLDCVAAQAETSGSPGGTTIDSTEVPNCAADLEFKYGSDMSAFSVTSAASDLSLFISSFLQGEQTFVYGVSYGSSLVERLIHLNTTDVAGYVLDGISTTSGSDKKNFEYFSTWDPDFDEVGNYFLSFCEKNQDDCGQFFKETSVSAALKTLTANLDSASYKCTSTADEGLALAVGYTPGTYPTSQALRSFMGTLLEDATLRTFIPVLTYRLTRCNDDDVKVIDHFFKRYAAYSSSSTSEDSTYESDLVYKMIVYSEFWETPTPSTETMLNRFLNTTISSGSYGEVETYCVFSKENSPGCAEFAKLQDYKASPLTYKRDAYWNVAAKPPSDVSVLLMSSKMDPQTPHKYAEFLYAALDTNNKKLLAFEQATHGTLWSTPLANDDDTAPICGMMIVASYVSVGGDLTKMDSSCMDKMPAVTFQVPERLVHTWLNASSAVDGKYTGKAVDASSGDDSGDSSSSSKYKTVFIVFLVLFIVALVAAAVFLVQWRRAKKASASAEVVEVYVDEGTPKA